MTTIDDRPASEAARAAARWLVRQARRGWAALVWLFAPMATSVKGALDRNDFRPIIAKILTMVFVAEAGFRATIHEPEVLGAIAILLVAAVSGALEAIGRLEHEPLTPRPDAGAAASPADPPPPLTPTRPNDP